MIRRAIATTLLLLCGTACAAEGYKDLKIQDLLGAAWPEFSAELDSLLTNARNEDAFYRMYKIAQRCDAESKVPQFLLKLAEKQQEKQQIQTLLGLFYRENRDYTQSIKYFREALKAAPDDYFVHYQLAHLLGKQDGEAPAQEAADHYAKAAERIGTSDLELKTRLLEEWGELLITRCGDAPAARTTAREAASKVWDRLIADERRFDRITYDRLAQIYQRYEMWDKAIATYRLCLTNVVGDDNAGRVRVLDQIGVLAERLNDNAQACAAYAEALGLVDDTHWLHKQLVVKLIKAHKKIGDDAAFVASLQKAVEQRPQSTGPLRDLALALDSIGDTAATIQTLEKARTLAPRDVTIISDLLLQYTKAGGALPQKAELYRKLAEVMPENFDAYVGLADTYWEMGDTAKVQEALNVLQSTASTLPDKQLVMARAFRKYGMKGNARNAFERAIAEGISGNDAAMELCAFCLDCAGNADSDAGKEALARAVELRNDLMMKNKIDESGYLRLMQIFQEHKRLDEARDIIGYAATNVFPKSFVCRYALADLHYSRREFYKAIQHFVAALGLAPSFYFKRMVNDRIITLTWNYGRRGKEFMEEPTAEEKSKNLLGGTKGEGLAPWIYYLQALVSNEPQNGDNMMLLAQINENTLVDAKVGNTAIRTDAGRAKALYKSVIDMDLKNLDAHSSLARTLVATDEFEGAIQENWVLEELSPAGKWQYIMNVGDLWEFAGYHDKSLQNWNTVSEQATSEPNLVYQLGCRMFQTGKIEEAINFVRKATAASKNEFRFHSTLANLLDQSGETIPGRYEEAVAEYKTAVELAGQNPGLTLYLQPVLSRLADVEIRLARSRFLDKKFVECAQSCVDGLAAIEKLKNNPQRVNSIADLNVLRARALIASGQKDGETLLRETLGAHPDTLYWYDDAMKMTGKHLLALFESGKMTRPEIAQGKVINGFKLNAGNVLALPARIGALQKGSVGALFLEAGGMFFRLGNESTKIEPLNLRSSIATISWLQGDFAAFCDSAGFSLIDMKQQGPVWKKDIAASSLFANEQYVACFYTKKPASEGQKVPPPASMLKMFDKKSGNDRWEIESNGGDVVFGEKVVIVRTASEITAVNLEDGKIAWRTPLLRNALWRRPILGSSTLLLIDDMANEIYAYDLATGAVKFQRLLGASLLCDPVISGTDRAIFHVLKKRIATLECLDTASGELVWESRLNLPAAQTATTAKEVLPESLGGINLPPISWNGWLLHYDAPRHRIWSARLDCGDVAPPIDLVDVCSPKMFDDVMDWGVTGDALYLASRTGHIALIKLVK
jgi:tetratricopeptide (TPR) repeat protein